jgi:hypothetical protein
MSYEVFSQRASRLMWKNAFVFIFYFDEFERAIRVRKEKVSYTLQPLEAYSLFDLDIEYSLLQSLTGGKYDSEVEMLLQLVER